jgi:hypothetical protein
MTMPRPLSPTVLSRPLTTPPAFVTLASRLGRQLHPPDSLSQTPLRVPAFTHKPPRSSAPLTAPPSLKTAGLRSHAAARVQPLVTRRHTLQLVQQPPPVVRQHLAVLDALLRPVLIPARDVVLRRLEVAQLVAQALLDEDGAVVLRYDGFFVLTTNVSNQLEAKGGS